MNDCLILQGNAVDMLRSLPSNSVDCSVSSPPYFGLRDYNVEGQIGLEPTVDGYVASLVSVFAEVLRVLKPEGTLWLNIGDTYAANRGYQVSDSKHLTHSFGQSNAIRVPEGMKSKDLMGIPWMVAFALRSAGWYLRLDIIWEKPNVKPQSVRDRPTQSHEYLFLLSKSRKYHYNREAVMEVGKEGPRNRRSVWSIHTKPYGGAHFAVFPPELVEPCILAGCPVGGTVLDPFAGSGTTGAVALKHGRRAILIELNPDYIPLIERRLDTVQPCLL